MLSKKVRDKCNNFEADTGVWAEDGVRNIQDLLIGDKVWAFSEESHSFQLQDIVHLIQREGEYLLIDITLDNGEVISTTDNHPFYVKIGDRWEWIEAGELQPQSILLDKEGSEQSVDIIERSPFQGRVFNLTIKNDHTFIVGQSGVITHNAGRCDDKLDKLHMYEGSRGGGVHHVSGLGAKWTPSRTFVGPMQQRGGFYELRIQNIANPHQVKLSTFFPDSMSRSQINAITRAAVYQRNFTNGSFPLDKIWSGYPSGINILVTKGPRGWHGSPRID